MVMDPYGGGYYAPQPQGYYPPYQGGYPAYDPACAQYYAQGWDPYGGGYGYGGGGGGGYPPHMMPGGYGYAPVRPMRPPTAGRLSNPLNAQPAPTRRRNPAAATAPGPRAPQAAGSNLISTQDANALHGGVKSNPYVHDRTLRESVRRATDETAPVRQRSVWGDGDEEATTARAKAQATFQPMQERAPQAPSRPSLGAVMVVRLHACKCTWGACEQRCLYHWFHLPYQPSLSGRC